MSGVPDPVCVLRHHERGPVTSLCFHSDGDKLLSGTQHGSINVWDVTSQRVVKQLNAHGAGAVLLVQQIDKGRILTHGRDGLIHIWNSDADDWTIADTFVCKAMGFCACLPFTRDNTFYVAIPSDDGSTVDITTCQDRHTTHLTPSAPGRSYGMCMCLAKRLHDSNAIEIIAGYEDGSVVLWGLENNQELNRLECFTDSVMALDYLSNLNKGVCASVNENVIVWTINKQNQLILLKTITITNPGVSCVKFRPDGKLLAMGGWDFQARLFSGKTYKALAVLSFHSATVHSVDFAPNNRLALGSKDGAITLWNVYK